MDQESMGSSAKPPIPKWLIVTLAIVVVAALGVGGWYFLGQKDQTTVKTSPSPTSTSNKYINSDSQFGFSFNLPKDYQVLEIPGGEGGPSYNLKIGKKTGDITAVDQNITIDIYKYERTLAEFKKEYEKDNADIIETSLIKIDGQDAWKYKIGGMGEGFHIIAVKDQYNLSIDFYPFTNESSPIFDEIVSSFKF